MASPTKLKKKYFLRYKKPLVPLPDLLATQKNSFAWLIKSGLKEVFNEFSPIRDYSSKKFELEFVDFSIDKPKLSEYEAKRRKSSFEAPLRTRVRLTNKSINESREQEIFLADFPLMTEHGTFIVNGIERVVVPQLARSFGVFFTVNEIRGQRLFGAKIIPSRGAWIEVETESDGIIYVRIDRRRKMLVSTLLRAFAARENLATDNASLLAAFSSLDGGARRQIEATFAADQNQTPELAYVDIYKRLRDSDLATPSNARDFFHSLFGSERYDLSEVGRHRFTEKFNISSTVKTEAKNTKDERVLSLADLALVIGHVALQNQDKNALADDIDHLGLRRVRSVGEMLQQRIKVGMTQMKRNIQDKMSTVDASTILPISIVNPRALQARLKEFFNTNQLSQFMNQENILSEVEHLRTLSALGPGGLTRERASLEVRDVHTSHYGRVCPIHTPEGPNIGLILRLSSYARVNDFGIIETPYRRVTNGCITDETVYLNALEEESFVIAHAGASYDDSGKLTGEQIEARFGAKPRLVDRQQVQFIEVSPNQAYSLATSLIPFLEHDDANRALMGSNMQKQSVPCVIPEAPLVATGIEEKIALESGRLIIARRAGKVISVDGRHLVVEAAKGDKDHYELINFEKSNDNTLFHQRPIVSMGEEVKAGQVIADFSSTADGGLAIGQNVRVAFMSWGGANYEDAIIISQRLVKDSKFTSIYVEEFEINVRDTKLGPEVTTHDIPNVSEAKLRNLDEDGVIRIGAEVEPNDILVGKITPKGETELSPEERLLRSIFGEKARDVKDSSLRVPHGKRGRVIGVTVFSRDRGDKLDSGIIKRMHIQVAQVRTVSVGDKLAGRHGNKGVVSRILPEEDMPYTTDGRPVDVILTPLGVPSRMNLGQIFEMHLGLAAHSLGYQAITPPFMGATVVEIKKELAQAGFSENGKVTLYDGQTGEKFAQDIAIGYMYILKLAHMVEDKIHMRSIGPYSLITQQPLGGRSQGGGQRFGEMEVWALEGYGAAYTLREMLTIKSDDIIGRSQAFDSIVKGEPIRPPNIPASFNVMLNELKGLALNVELLKTRSVEEDQEIENE